MTSDHSIADLLTELAALHAPVVTTDVAVKDDNLGDFRDIDPASFEGMTSETVRCMTCHFYPEWPCFQAALLRQHGIEFERSI